MKFIVSAGLLVVLLGALDWALVYEALADISPVALGIALAILILQFPVSAWKWRISLSIHDLHWRVATLVKIGLIGFFFNNFFPTAIGGDIYRAYRTAPADKEKSRAISALLLDRIIGLLALLLVAAVGAAAIWLRNPSQLTGLLILAFLAPVVGAATLPWLTRLRTVAGLLARLAEMPRLAPLVLNGRLIAAQPSKLWRLTFAAIVFQALAVVAIYFLFASVRVSGVLAESAVVGAASVLASLLPISINGIGVMESSFALTAREFGVDLESAVIVSLLLRLSTVLFSVAGALMFWLDRGRASDLAAVAAAEKSGGQAISRAE